MACHRCSTTFAEIFGARRCAPALGVGLVLVLSLGLTAQGRAQPVRASYFYSYMALDHLDALAEAGFNRAVIKCIGDTLTSRVTGEFGAFLGRGPGLGIEVIPDFSLQSRARLASIPSSRRYTWGSGNVEPEIGCPLDSLFWSSTLVDRGAEFLRTFPDLRRLVVDLEIYTGSGARHHYDEPCRCGGCLNEFAARDATAPQDLEAFEEDRLATLLEGLLDSLAATRSGLEVGFFDLDFDAFVHRAMVRALVRTGLPTTNYSERTYTRGASAIPESRAPLSSLGLHAPLICGLKLKTNPPSLLPAAARADVEGSEGYFIFTSYSLWQPDLSKLTGQYELTGTQAEYWEALRIANRAPEAHIVRPLEGSVVAAGTVIDLGGTAVDPREAPESLAYRWEADLLDHGVPSTRTVLDGPNASLAAASTDDGSGASYRIRLIVSNSSGLVDTVVQVVNVLDGRPPLFTSGPAVVAGEGTAQVQWSVSEDATGVVRYGPTPEMNQSVATGSSRSHAASLSGLAGGTLYYWCVAVTDGAGNMALSSVGTFTTLAVYPRTPGLDNFNRANSSMGTPWTSTSSALAIRSNALAQISSGSPAPIWNGAVFGGDQEAYVTLTAISSSSTEHALLLKCQGTSYRSGALKVRYDARAKRISVATYGSDWKTRGTIVQTLVAGDRFGARAYANGNVEVFRNGVKLGTVSVSSWSHAAKPGRIGIALASATGARLDDFGGGTLPAATAAVTTATTESDASHGVGPADTPDSGVEAERTALPERIEISRAFPNPSADRIALELVVGRARRVEWEIFDFQGRRIWGETRELPVGRSMLIWSGRDDRGHVAEPGIYWVRLTAGAELTVRRFVLLR